MILQLALDRMDIAEAVRLTKEVEDFIDWIEVGTSLIKEFGMKSVKELKQAFPDKRIVADMKTMDNARYEFEMAFEAGADVATVMGVSPLVTMDACMEVASRMDKTVMIDLMNAQEDQVRKLLTYREAVFCVHVSKDEQEAWGAKHSGEKKEWQFFDPFVQWAIAGGITAASLAHLRKTSNPSIVIVGSAITKAKNPAKAANELKQVIQKGE